jgi:transketolase
MRTKGINWTDADTRNVNLSRGIALDVLSKAGSGHPGATLSLTPVIYLLVQKIMAHDANDPSWSSRDKLILSCGHASLALYIQLNLAGYEITKEDLYGFRKLGSKTPGHPEYLVTPGIETTTGPLGQGLGNAVGIALSAKIHEQKMNQGSEARKVYCVVSDGDLQEGISFEAASLAAHYELNNLIVVFDSNEISIDGPTNQSTSLNMEDYFLSLGWEVSNVAKTISGEIDVVSLANEILKESGGRKPRLIILESEIGWPSPTYKSKAYIHGNMLPTDEITKIKKLLEIETSQELKFPNQLLSEVRQENEKRRNLRTQTSIEGTVVEKLDSDVISNLIREIDFPETISTRKANGRIIQEIKGAYCWTIGGSADLTESNGLSLDNLFTSNSSLERFSNSLSFGVREHAMSSISNGMALDPNNIVYCATYLGFSDYQRPAIRLSALMGLPVTYIWTHDSIALGADGPTHQPIEHLAALRAIPNFSVVRPGSAAELKMAWIRILKDRKPAGLVLSRQDLSNRNDLEAISSSATKGGYIYYQNFQGDNPEIVLIATGSELDLAQAVSRLERFQNLRVRVVSLPCWEWFMAESVDYQESILSTGARLHISIEAGSTFGWEKFTGRHGLNIGIDRFGESGGSDALMDKFGFTVEAIAIQIVIRLENSGRGE